MNNNKCVYSFGRRSTCKAIACFLPGYVWINKKCYKKCDKGFILNTITEKCQCPNGTVEKEGKCMSICEKKEIWING